MWPSGRTGYAAICRLMIRSRDVRNWYAQAEGAMEESATSSTLTNRYNSIKSCGDGTIAIGARAALVRLQ